MRLLAMILVTLGIIKLIIAYILNKSEIQNMSIMPPIDLEELTKGAVNFLILDGLIGIFCGIYLL